MGYSCKIETYPTLFQTRVLIAQYCVFNLSAFSGVPRKL